LHNCSSATKTIFNKQVGTKTAAKKQSNQKTRKPDTPSNAKAYKCLLRNTLLVFCSRRICLFFKACVSYGTLMRKRIWLKITSIFLSSWRFGVLSSAQLGHSETNGTEPVASTNFSKLISVPSSVLQTF